VLDLHSFVVRPPADPRRGGRVLFSRKRSALIHHV
jgi:hypothetical protein